MGLIRGLLFALAGGLLFGSLPAERIVSASQELIALLALLMAGLLPAMVLTATILRGAFSPRKTDQYADALRTQLLFWAVLFAAAALGTVFIIAAKIAKKGPIAGSTEIDFPWLFCIGAGAAIGVVAQRLLPAYRGIVSLLDLNADIAKHDASKLDTATRSNERSSLAAVRNPPEYEAFAATEKEP